MKTKKRIARLPGGDYCFPYRQQVEAAYHAKLVDAALALQ